MHLDLTWIFSIFKVPKISRAVSGSDARNLRRASGNYFRLGQLWRAPCYYDRNVKSRLDATFSIPDLRTAEALASTSASIVKAGLNKVWRTNLESKATSRPPEHGSQAPSVPSKKPCPKARQHGRIPQPITAPILTHLPFPQSGQLERREPYISADPQHPSGSRFFSLQKSVNKESDSEQIVRPPSPNLKTSRAFSSVSQPAAVPLRNRIPIVSFGSSATKGSKSTERNIGLDLFTAGQYPFYSSSVSSLRVTLFDFLPNTASPSQSLLFRPPSPPPKRKLIINPEEDAGTVPLPPAPEPLATWESNQFGTTTCPVRSLASASDHELPINTLPSPSLLTGNVRSLVPVDILNPKSQDHTVPCSPLFPTQSSNTLSLSPLPIALTPLAAPPPPELVIKIANPEGYYLNADYHKSQIKHFLISRATEVANSLVVIWQLSHIDSGGRRGLMSLKNLFAQLDEKVLDSDSTALSRFSQLSITIPDRVTGKDLPQPVKEDDSIDLANAMDLHEFAWHGDFVIFASKFKNISFVTLTSLNIKSSSISIEDAITLLHSCSNLQTVSLGTIRSEKDSDAIMSLKSSSGVERKALPNLTLLALESDVALHPLIRRFCWTAQVSLSLTLRKQGTASFLDQAFHSGPQ
jgi:hypothetical protein